MSLSLRSQSEWVRIGCLALLALVVAGYQAASAFYRGFRVPQGTGMNHLLPEELAHYALYLLFGGAAAALAYGALRGLPLCDRLGDSLSAFCGRPLAPAIAASALVLAVSLALGHFVLGHAVTTDDEHVYRFIARTLWTGHWVAPSPGTDLDFFREQFVVLNERVRYGKYPLGWPLLLALGQGLRAEALVTPVVTALAVFPLHRLASRLFGRRVAGAACLLYAASPQVWFVGATYLSQPASALALACALALLVPPRGESAPGLVACALAGASLGFGVLVRPLPGVLFAAAAGVSLLFAGGEPPVRRVRRAIAFGIPCAALALALLLVNRAQSGAAMVSGYQEFHMPGETIGSMIGGEGPLLAMSVASALIRTNFWLFGWPLSLPLCLLAGRLPRPWLLGGVIAAEVLYRLLSPKAGVGGTGSIYVFEAVPLLCLLAAEGLARVVRGEIGWFRGRPGPAPAAAALVALSATAVAFFVPPKLADLGRMGAAQLAVERQAAARGLRSALIFHDGVVPPWTGLSWAYFPRCNGPRLDDDVLFVRFQRQGDLARNLEFWRRRFPERTAWYFGWEAESGPLLRDLSVYVLSQSEQRQAAAPAAPGAPSGP